MKPSEEVIHSVTDIHDECHAPQSRSVVLNKEKCFGHLVGCLGPLIVPFVHIGLIYRLWSRYNRHVDVKTCTCSCWDTVFKGSYETGISSYKHVYFNSTINTYQIWIITVIAVIGFYEFGKHIFILIYRNQIRWRMGVLLVSIIYPHYYSWWSYFNYLNDDFYSQWYHQMYFTVTELLSTISVLLLANKKRHINVTLLLIILNVAAAHIIVSGFDQLVANVVRGEGSLHQVLRDIGMFVPDIMHMAVVLYDLKKLNTGNRVPTYYLVSNKQFMISVFFIILSCVVCLVL